MESYYRLQYEILEYIGSVKEVMKKQSQRKRLIEP